MPSVSGSQQRFMGMVRAVQKGDMSLDKASPRVREVAMKMHPKDTAEFAATKTKDLPDKVEKKSDLVKTATWPAIVFLAKQADIHSIIDRTRQSVQAVGKERRRHLEAEVKALRQHSAKLQQSAQKANMTAASSQAAMSAMPPQAPAPPPAQAAYGAMLMPPPDEEAKKK